MVADDRTVAELLDRYRSADDTERADVERVRALVQTAADPWHRSLRLHVTASAMVVHSESERVLLRWHRRLRSWLLVGGHADPGEHDPLAIALREGREETGLADLTPWPDGELRHVAIVAVAADSQEPDHEHADLRFVLATRAPGAARAEHPDCPVRWLSLPEARETITEANVRATLSRVELLLASRRA